MIHGAAHSFELCNAAIRQFFAVGLLRVMARHPTIGPTEDRIQLRFGRAVLGCDGRGCLRSPYADRFVRPAAMHFSLNRLPGLSLVIGLLCRVAI